MPSTQQDPATTSGVDAHEAIPTCVMLPSEQDTLLLQAHWDAGELLGASTSTTTPGYHGRGYVTGLSDPSHRVQLTLHLPPHCPSPCILGLWLRYRLVFARVPAMHRAPHGNKVNALHVDAQPPLSLRMPCTEQWGVLYAGRWVARHPTCLVCLQSDWGWVDLDVLYVYCCRAVACPSQNPRATQHGSPAARLVHLLLQLRAQGRVLTGQQGRDEASVVQRVTGKLPAVLGLDLLNYTPTIGWNDGTPETAMQWHQAGGIVTICWHWFSPAQASGPKSFYTEQTAFCPAAALDPSHPHHTLLLRDIDAIASQLQRLQHAGVPVLWRPLHEAEGGWFWWGRAGPDVFRRLWRLLYERLTGVHGLRNLVWLYTSEGDGGASHGWYPGDALVDIVTTDVYGKEGYHGSHARRFHELTLLPSGAPKLVALGEVGSVPCLDACMSDMAPWSWFCTWNGHFATDGVWNSPDALRRAYHHPSAVDLQALTMLRVDR